ncbi:MAG TPA: T9SS type A sorting domain-containing protein [Rubricoccaceae bacterium]|nr:T9SS type A sorting domain-containing protein [Rubricoccaceae bacterium]
MRALLSALLLLAGAPTAYAQLPFALDAEVWEATVGEDGAIYATGVFYGAVDFDPGPGVAALTATSFDGFVAVYEADGTFRLALRIDAIGNGYLYMYGIAPGPDGSITIAGDLIDGADFDPGLGEHILTGSYRGFVARYTPDGSLGSAFFIASPVSGSTGDAEAGWGCMMPTTEGRTFLCGRFNGTVDFDPGPGEAIRTSGPNSAFVVIYDAAGAFGEVRVVSGTAGVSFRVIRPDPAGGFATLGHSSGTVDLDPGPDTFPLSPGPFIARYTMEMVPRDGFTLPVWANSFAVDTSEATYITGSFDDPADFDPGPGTHLLTPRGYDAFVAKYDSSHALVYAFAIGGDSNLLVPTDGGQDIEAGDAGEAYATGYFTDDADFDPGPGEHILHGSFTQYVARYSAEGAIEYVFTLSSSGGIQQFVPRLVPRVGDTFLAYGSFSGSLDVDPGPGEVVLSSPRGTYFVPYHRDGRIVVAGEPEAPAASALRVEVGPNPLSSHTVVVVTSPHAGPARVAVYDARGREIAVLLSGERAVGRHEVTFDASALAPGVYFVRAEAGARVATRALTVLR